MEDRTSAPNRHVLLPDLGEGLVAMSVGRFVRRTKERASYAHRTGKNCGVKEDVPEKPNGCYASAPMPVSSLLTGHLDIGREPYASPGRTSQP